MLTNLRHELRLRLRQAAVLSAGLGIAVGAGLLTTAGPASAARAGPGGSDGSHRLVSGRFRSLHIGDRRDPRRITETHAGSAR
ncbi:MAG: hypothetical protein ACRDRJ_31105, partial [Streptosporangiaceae bacterium]